MLRLACKTTAALAMGLAVLGMMLLLILDCVTSALGSALLMLYDFGLSTWPEPKESREAERDSPPNP